MSMRKLDLIIMTVLCLLAIPNSSSSAVDRYPHRVIFFGEWGNTSEENLGFLPGGYTSDGGHSEPGDGPRAFDIDVDGNIYFADTEKNRIVKCDRNGKYLTGIGWYGRHNVEYTTKTITLKSLSGEKDYYARHVSLTAFGLIPPSILGRPNQVAVDANGNIYVSCLENHGGLLHKFNKDGDFVHVIDRLGPYTTENAWGIKLEKTNDGGIMVAFGIEKVKGMKKLYFDKYMNYLGEDIGFPDKYGRRYRLSDETHNNIATGVKIGAWDIEMHDPRTKEKVTLSIQLPDPDEGIVPFWYLRPDGEGYLYFKNSQRGVRYRINHRGETVNTIDMRIEEYSLVDMAISTPVKLTAQGTIIRMVPTEKGLYLIEILCAPKKGMDD